MMRDMRLQVPSAPAVPAVLTGRCNPFGHSTGRGGDAGPRHLAGGLYTAAYEGAQKWFCPNAADGRYRMSCACGHVGQEMKLCYAHVAMITRRMSRVCPPCVMPPQALALHEQVSSAQAAVGRLMLGRADPLAIRAAIAQVEDLGRMMNELVERGVAHKCPLTLTEIS
jgi:hypothetical protein